MVLQKITDKIRGFPDWVCTSISDFDKWIYTVSENNQTVVFRGQSKHWPLLPSISRNNQPANLLPIEKELLSAFKQEGKKCLHLIPETDWDWLVVGQHHGLPTRVLDWSYNPYVALWFALKKLDQDDFDQNDFEPQVWVFTPAKGDIIDSLVNSRPFQGNRTKLFNTDFKIPRIREQEGCFVLFKYIENSSKGFIPLERDHRLRKRIKRIRIRLVKSAAPKMLDEIKKKGFNESRLFPNIDDITRSIKERIFNDIV